MKRGLALAEDKLRGCIELCLEVSLSWVRRLKKTVMQTSDTPSHNEFLFAFMQGASEEFLFSQ